MLTTESEAARIATLASYEILDTPPEAGFDDLARLAAHVCHAPIALVSLIDPHRQWFKAHHGLEINQTPRSQAFCVYALANPEALMIVPDARLDPRFQGNPLVTGLPGIRFYAGAPLVAAEGHVLGTLCVIDRKPRRLNAAQRECLAMLSRQVVALMEARRQAAEQWAAAEALRESEKKYRLLSEGMTDALSLHNPDGSYLYASPSFQKLTGYSPEEAVRQEIAAVIYPEDMAAVTEKHLLCLSGQTTLVEWRRLRRDGSYFWVETTASPIYDAAGRLIQIACLTRDITERRRMQAERQEQEASAHRFQEALKELHQVTVELSQAPTVDEFCRQVIELGRRCLGYDRLSLWLASEEEGVLRGTYGTDEMGRIRPEGSSSFSLRRSKRNTAYQERPVVVLNDHSLVDDAGRAVGKGWHIAAAVREGAEVIGLLNADNLICRQPLQPHEAEVLGLYGAAVGHLYSRLKIEQRLKEREQEAHRFQEALKELHQVTVELSQSETPEALCRAAVELGRDQLGLDRLSLWLISSDPDILHGTYGTDENGETRDERVEQFVSTQASRRKMFQLQSVVSLPEWPLSDERGRPVGYGWHLTAAVRDGEQVVGVLNVDNLLRRRPLQPHEAELLGLYGAAIGHLYSRLKIEQMLKEREAKRRLALEAAQMGEWEIEATSGELYLSSQAVAILSGIPEEQRRLNYTQMRYVHPEDQAQIVAGFECSLNTGEAYASSYRIFWPDGSLHWGASKGRCVLDADGRVERLIGVLTDITEQRQSEEAIRALNHDLEVRVLERTRQLEAANRELEAFAYSVSHDLRAPLRGIDGFSQALLEDFGDVLDTVGSEYIQIVRSETQRMGQLIDDLLNLSRVTRREMHTGPVDLSALAAQVVAALRQQDPERTVEVIIEPVLTAEADAGLLRAALENLLGNAWKFTSKRFEARIEVGQNEQSGKRAFFVRDNGAGFDMAYAHKLFGAFQRLHTAQEFPGTGIGLATVQRIVHRHGGQVWAEGAVGQGAAFYFVLA